MPYSTSFPLAPKINNTYHLAQMLTIRQNDDDTFELDNLVWSSYVDDDKCSPCNLRKWVPFQKQQLPIVTCWNLVVVLRNEVHPKPCKPIPWDSPPWPPPWNLLLLLLLLLPINCTLAWQTYIIHLLTTPKKCHLNIIIITTGSLTNSWVSGTFYINVKLG